MFKSLTTHEIPMVRKFASKSLSSLLRVVPASQERDVLEIVNSMIKDDQDLVRIYVVDALIPLAGLLAPPKYSQILLPMFNALADDQSWRIKYAICEKCQEVRLFGGTRARRLDRRGLPEGLHQTDLPAVLREVPPRL